MPKLKQRKDGGYFIHKPGDANPVNTFQVTDEGAEIALSSGCELEESFPDELFYLLHDLGHLSTKGTDTEDTGFEKIRNLDWAVKELSLEDRVQVAIQIAETHGVRQLLEGDAAEWIFNLTGKSPAFLEPLVRTISEETGYCYETIREYNTYRWPSEKLLETAFSAYLQTEALRTKKFEQSENVTGSNEVLGTDGEFVYIELGETPRQGYDIAGEIPESVPEELENRIGEVLWESIGIAAFAELSRIEIRSRYGVDDGMVLPRERLQDLPVDVPPRSDLTEQYEAFRLLQNHVNRVLSSPAAGVEHGDGSPCDQWYNQVQERLQAGSSGEKGLGEQQAERVDHSAQLYRDCFGDGDKVTDFVCINMSQPSESQQLKLFPFGIFDQEEDIKVPVAPDSGDPLPVYPQSQYALDQAIELLDEFSAKPSTGTHA